METQSEYGVLSPLQSNFKEWTKSDISRISVAILNKVADGAINPLEAFLAIKKLSELTETLITELKSQAVKEALKYGKLERKMLGCEFSVTEPAQQWDYSNIPQWIEFQTRIDELNLLIKSVKAAQALVEECALNGLTDVNTGEIYAKPNAGKSKLPFLTVKIK